MALLLYLKVGHVTLPTIQLKTTIAMSLELWSRRTAQGAEFKYFFIKFW